MCALDPYDVGQKDMSVLAFLLLVCCLKDIAAEDMYIGEIALL